MNTSFLSMLSGAPPLEQAPAPSRPAKAGRAGVETAETGKDTAVQESESTGDSDKATAFAEMLAAMISVATPATETQVDSVQPAAVEQVTSSTTDIPRDGAGSPLFGASFTVSTPQTTTSVAAASATDPAESLSAMGMTSDAETTATTSGATLDTAGSLSEAAASEIAALGQAEPNAEPAELSVEAAPDTATLDETTIEAFAPVENDVPVVAVRETSDPVTTSSTDRPDTAQGVATTRQPAQSSPADDTAQRPAADAPVADAAVANTDAVAAAEAIAEPSGPAVGEAQAVETAPVPQPGNPVADEASAAIEQPHEQPQAQRTERREGSSPKSSASSRPTSAPSPRSDVTADSVTLQPETPNAVTAVEPSPEAGVHKDVVRQRGEAPVERLPDAAAAPIDAEALVATGAATSDSSNSSAATSVVTGQADAAVVSTPAHVSQQVLQALAAYEAELPQGGARSFELLLDPPELGRLLVQMSRTSKGVDVRISAENESVRSILETSGTELQQSLQLSGFDLGQFSGSGSGGEFAHGEEWVSAPTLQSFAAQGQTATPAAAPPPSGNSAVNVMV